MRKYLPIVFLVIVGIASFLVIRLRMQSVQTTIQSANKSPKTIQTAPSLTGTCIPTFRDGGGPYYQANAPFRSNLAPESTAGEPLTVTGKVLASDCQTPLANVILDIWQANESGSYEDQWYRGRITTDAQGNYTFSTVVPKGYGEGTGYRPPHIHFKVWQDNQELVTSQMFLPASRAQGIEEAYIMKLETNSENGTPTHQGEHHIILP